MSLPEKKVSMCRFCAAACPVSVTMEDGLPTNVTGNRASPSYNGFCCTRGQAMVDLFRHPDRLLHSQRRTQDGHYVPIGSEVMMDEIAEKVRKIVAEHGPDSVAIYFGTMTGAYPLAASAGAGWMISLGSRMIFSSMTIDQPGKLIAAAMIGGWEAGPQGFTDADVWMMVGSNPLVSIGGTLPKPNSPRRLRNAIDRGMKLIVIDPRRTETARLAAIHLQPLPGHDAAIIAAMIRIIIAEELYDRGFIEENAEGFETLRQAVASIDPAQVAHESGLELDQLTEAARVFATAGRGIAAGSTGANMSGRSTLTEYLVQSLNVLCGRYIREGEAMANPGVLLPRARPRAQPRAPIAANDPAQQMSVRGLTASVAGLPTAALSEEILSGKIKALFSVGGNPVVAFPDQDLTIKSLQALDLFVQVDVRMTPSAQLAHYVVAPKITFEVPTTSYSLESLELYFGGWALPEPYGLYAPKLADPPAGSDVIEEWEFFWGLAKRAGMPMRFYRSKSFTGPRRETAKPIDVPMDVKPTTDDLLELMTSDSRISLAEVRKFKDGALFPEEVLTAPKDPACTARLQLADPSMMDELRELAGSIAQGQQGPDMGEHDFLLVCRRAAHLNNSTGLDAPRLMRKGGTTNPAYLNPLDLERLAVAPGGDVEILSDHGVIRAVAASDDTLRPGVISMTHAYGRLPSEQADHRRHGSNTGRLLSTDHDFDRYSGIPRMSALPVSVRGLNG